MNAIHRKARVALGFVAALGAAMTLSGCNENATAPAPEIAAVAPAIPASLITVQYVAEDSLSATFTVDSGGGTFELGPHAIHFPQNAICEPLTSTYGLGEWDQPCTPTERTLTIHATIVHANGREWIDFAPALRFVPDRPVWLWMKVDPSYDADAAPPLNMLWMPAPGLPAIDESVEDPSLATQHSSEHAVVYRRIKHFSGYMVAMD